jgi:hypothetical protein
MLSLAQLTTLNIERSCILESYGKKCNWIVDKGKKWYEPQEKIKEINKLEQMIHVYVYL